MRQVVIARIQRHQTYRFVKHRMIKLQICQRITRAVQAIQPTAVRHIQRLKLIRPLVHKTRHMCAIQLLQLLVLAQVQLCNLRLAHVQDTQVRVLRYIHARYIGHFKRQLQQIRAIRRVYLRQRARVVSVKRLHLRILRQIEVGVKIAHHRYLQEDQRVLLAYHQRRRLRKRVVRYIERANLRVLA